MTDRTNVVTWRIDGVDYAVDLYDIDGLEWRDAKRVTGLRQQEIVDRALGEKDWDAIAALIWVMRRREEPALAYEDVLKGLTYRAFMDDAGEDDSLPPA